MVGELRRKLSPVVLLVLLVFMGVDFFAKQRIFLGGNRASRDPGRRNGGVMRNPNYTYADTRQPSPGDEGQQESPHVSI